MTRRRTLTRWWGKIVELHRLLEMLPDAALLVAPGGTIVFASQNVEDMLGFQAQELVGREVESLLPHGQRPQHRMHRADYGRDPHPRAMERGLQIMGLHRDGHTVPIAVSLAPFSDDEEPLTLALIRDLTEMRRRETDLLHAQRMGVLGQMATGIAHDFNNLLTVISGSAGSLNEMLSEDHAGRAEAEVILEAGRRAAGMAHHLLSLARRGSRVVAPVDLNHVVRNMEAVLTRVLGDDIEILLELEEAVGPVLADPDEIGQIILNLAVNARDAMPDGGRLTFITLALRGAGPANGQPSLGGPIVILRARDTGIGIEKEILGQVFDSFFTTKTDGTGLGLATTRDIVERFGGTIQVSSTPGEGTEFEVRLPLAFTHAR